MIPRRILLCLSFAVFSATTVSYSVPSFADDAREVKAEWKLTDIPASWKKLPGGHYGDREYHAWFRCLVEVPKSWEKQKLELFVEAVDDAREVYFNGDLIGALGTFPPEYRSGLGKSARFAIDGKKVLPGQKNVVAIRVYQNQGRGGFNVAAPVLFGEKEAIRLQGSWQVAVGDNLDWGKLSGRNEIDAKATYAKLDDAEVISRTLKNLDNDPGPQTIANTLKQITVPEDLTIELAVGEPAVRQPLSIKWDERGRMWVMQYLQYPTFAGLKMLSRDKYLRSVYDKIPLPPPHHDRGNDKITIHEDTDGDGVYDKHKTFVDGLNMATSFARGRRGVWVLNPPYLLFYPDRDNDDAPDGDPEVHLEGFGLEDSHSITNNLRWGPDGWLYASQGSTVTGHVKRYGSKDKPIDSMGQLIWRYHPETRRYEIFAEGGGNSFGVEFDSKGRVYSGHNGGDTRGFHYVQGAYLQKGFGKHGELSNPYAFGYFAAMAHHSVPRFTHTFVIYEGAALPAHYHGKLFGVGPLQGHVVYSEFTADRSSFKTKDLGHPLTSNDKWVRPVDIQTGPDGALYVVDMYEQRIDHASHYQGRIHRESGRVYRLRGNDAGYAAKFDLGKLPTRELIDVLRHDNKWHRQTALRLLADRRDKEAISLLKKYLADNTGQFALECLWALNLSGGLDEETALHLLAHEEPQVRAWTVRLMCDDQKVSGKLAAELASLATGELNVYVRSQLASSARRLSAAKALPIVRNLLLHSEDADDIHLPLLLWWAIEDKADAERDEVLAMFRDKELWDQAIVKQHIVERLMRRYAQAGLRKDLLTCAALLELAPSKEHAKQLLAGFEVAYKGRSLSGLPDELVAAMAKAGGGSLALRIRQGDLNAVDEALRIVADAKADKAQRALLVGVFGDIRLEKCVPVLLELAESNGDHSLRAAALASLQAYTDAAIGGKVVAMHNNLPAEVREVAQTLLASRKSWSLDLLAAIDAGSIKADDIPLNAVRKVMLHQDKRIGAAVQKHWGTVQGATTEQMLADIERVTGVINSGSGIPHNGKKLFANTCGKCHVLFKEGGQIGPDLTSFKRDDLRRMLVNVINPSIEIREGYENYVVQTDDGRTLNGFIEDQDNQVVVLKGTDGQSVIIPRDDIEEMAAIKRSIMPEQILKPLSDQQIRDLFAYLRATQPLP